MSARHIARTCGVMVMAITSAVFTAATTAHAATGGGSLGGAPPELGVGLLVAVAGTETGSRAVYAVTDRAVPRPVFTRAIAATSGGVDGDLSNLCNDNTIPPNPQFPIANGWVFNIQLFASSDGHYIATIGAICVARDPARPNTPPVAPVVAQPPTIGEVWRSVGLPAPTLGVSPQAHGVTGLATWVWTGGSPAPVAVAVNLRGYTVSGTARVTGYAAYPGTGGWIVGDDPGSPNDPAFAHTYEQTGTYRLGVATLWSANAVLSGPGLATPIAIDLGTAVVTNGRDYPVVQIRSRLL